MTMAKENISYFTLANGLRGVHIHLPHAAVGYCGVTVRAGSRDEDVSGGEAGLAHFVEHTIFKGTNHRSPWHIINRMEAVGGELNAFTTKEDTTVYTIFPRGNLRRALDLVADLVINSRFPDAELDKEREVVADEIDSYLDQPGEAVFDDFEDLIFADTPLGHNILGTTESLRGFSSASCRGWLERYYTASRMVVFYAGNIGAESFRMMAEDMFAPLHKGETPVPQPISLATGHFAEHRGIDSHQCHTVIGSAFGRVSESMRMPLALVTNILGGPGMNSLLNIALRERRGLVYNVESSASLLSDATIFTIYYGCDPHDNALCDKLVREQLEKMATSPLSDRRLRAAKKQFLGQSLIAAENRENSAIGIARATLMRGSAYTADDIRHMTEAITPADILAAAELLADPSSLTLGPK